MMIRGGGGESGNPMIRSQSFNKPVPLGCDFHNRLSAFPLPPSHCLGETGSLELVFSSLKLGLNKIIFLEGRMLWGYFKMVTFPLFLLEASGDFSSIFTLRTW